MAKGAFRYFFDGSSAPEGESEESSGSNRASG